MRLRTKVLLSQLPLIIAASTVAVVGANTALRLGAEPNALVHENLRTSEVSAVILRSLEQLSVPESGARDGGPSEPDRDASRAAIDAALVLQRENITEPGEAELTEHIASLWAAVRRGEDHLMPDLVRAVWSLQAINQAAMRDKSARVEAGARRAVTSMWLSLVGALFVGFVASVILLRRLVRQVGAVERAVERIGEGRYDEPAGVAGSDELASLGAAVDAMAARLDHYERGNIGRVAAEREQMRAVLDSLLDPVLVLEPDGEVRASNARGRQLADLPAVRDALGDVWSKVARGEGVHRPQRLDEAVEIVVDGEARRMLIGASPVHTLDGRVRGVTVALQDVTSLHRLDGFKRDLAATGAHALRTPLTSLRMGLHLCLDEVPGPLTKGQRLVLRTALDACEQITALVDELLDLARLEAPEATMHREPLSAASLCERARQSFEPMALAKGVRITCRPGDATAAIDGDRAHLRHVFDNLLSNALRHAAQGGRVELGWSIVGSEVVFVVDDDGPGIRAEDRERVFDRFFRAPGQSDVGTGLGLSIVRETIEAHDGRVGVERSALGGASFWFALPRSATGQSSR